YALGLVMGELYKQALAQTERIENKQLMERRKKEVEKRYLEQALFYLKACVGNEVESPEYVKGLIAFYEKSYEDALDNARRAFEHTHWLYEAKVLEGNIHTVFGDKKREKGDYDGAIKEYEEAGQAYLIAIEMGRSDSTIYLGEGQRWVSIM